jgi:hypothetical protein
MARAIARETHHYRSDASARTSGVARAALVVVGVVVGVGAAVTLGTMYSLVWTGGESLDSLVRDVQVTTAGIMTAEAALLWLVLKRAYGRSAEQMGAQARALAAALAERARTTPRCERSRSRSTSATASSKGTHSAWRATWS